MPLTFKEVAEILKLIDASDCEEVVLELEGLRLVVRRGGGNTEAVRKSGAKTQRAQVETAAAAPATPPDPDLAPAAEPGITEVRSPMVGTFYRCPSPEEPPFVEVGAKVKKGDPLCLIEVMKLFTTIESPARGAVVSIETEDASSVEFNQLLFKIKAK